MSIALSIVHCPLSIVHYMKSMLFAAGLGIRLRPLTNDRPKAMVELKGKPLLQWSIERLIAAGSR
ncbi:MAG: sugar phosphate nucleotidyltransferase, partial [Saprospiraceae bacterium]